MNNIKWRTVAEFPDYEVSNTGLVRRVTMPVAAIPKSNPLPYLLKQTTHDKGYRSVRLYDRGRKKSCFIHRLVAQAFIGDPPSPKHHAAHRNDIPDDNRADNIYWATNDENAQDRVRHGGYLSGTQVHNSKLNDDSVTQIRALYAAGGVSQRALARRFGVCQAVIRDIVTYKTWRAIAAHTSSASV